MLFRELLWKTSSRNCVEEKKEPNRTYKDTPFLKHAQSGRNTVEIAEFDQVHCDDSVLTAKQCYARKLTERI